MIGRDFVNKPVFLSNTAGPVSRQIPCKRFRLAGSMKRVPRYLGNQFINLTKDFHVFFGPLSIFGKSGVVKNNHSLVAGLGAGYGFFQSFKATNIFPLFYIFNRRFQPFPVSRRTAQVFGFILFPNRYFNVLVRVCVLQGVNKTVFKFSGIEFEYCFHTRNNNGNNETLQGGLSCRLQKNLLSSVYIC